MIGNAAQKKNATHHYWSLYVRPLFDVKLVREVTFQLHPTFPNPFKTLREPPFELSGQAYGTFDVEIVVFPSSLGGTPAKFTHFLQFVSNESTHTIPVASFISHVPPVHSFPTQVQLQRPPRSMIVRCTAQKLDGRHHAFTVTVQPSPGRVQEVVLELHPSFRNPRRVLKQSPFQISGRAWGTFPIKVTIVPPAPDAPKVCDFDLTFYDRQEEFALWT